MRDDERGTGRTSRQMREAPRNAIFVWCNDYIGYAIRLAYHLDRGDLSIIPPAMIGEFRRGSSRHIVVDHAAVLLEEDRVLISLHENRLSDIQSRGQAMGECRMENMMERDFSKAITVHYPLHKTTTGPTCLPIGWTATALVWDGEWLLVDVTSTIKHGNVRKIERKEAIDIVISSERVNDAEVFIKEIENTER